MSDVTRLEFMNEPTPAVDEAQRHAARLAVVSWRDRHNEPAGTLRELLDELGLGL